MVREGVDDGTLRRSVGHIPETPLPGQPGNVGLAGHRDTFFRQLHNVHKNDRIAIRTLNGEYDYVVDSLTVVKPSDVQVLASTGENVLTLVTCYPFNSIGHAPRRYIVRARRVTNGESGGQ
jgi:sortase A